jgi:hypothetical protein
MQSIMAVLGTTIVASGEIILQIHLEVTVLCSALPQEGI